MEMYELRRQKMMSIKAQWFLKYVTPT